MAKKWLKTELHSHTLEDPEDGGRLIVHTPAELLDAAADQGFEVLAITNHNQQFFTPDLACQAERRGILLIPGVEATLRGRHVLLYNFPDYHPSWRDPDIVRRHKGPAQLVIAPHPFFPSRSALRGDFHGWRDLFDAVEYNHFYLRFLNFNRRAARESAKLGLPMVANSDVHHLFQLGRSYSLIHAEKTVESVFEAIRRNEIRRVSEPVGAGFIARFFLTNAYHRLRFALNRSSSPVLSS